jgi:hypothetical protein
VAQQEDSDGFPSYAWNQFAFDGLFGYQAHRPTGAAWRWTAAHHCNQTLFLAIVENFGGPRPLPFVQRPLQPTFLVTPSDITYGLSSQWDHVGDSRWADALRQLP